MIEVGLDAVDDDGHVLLVGHADKGQLFLADAVAILDVDDIHVGGLGVQGDVAHHLGNVTQVVH